MTPVEVEALRWAVRRAVDAEDRAERWLGWGRPTERADEIATHAAAVERVRALRSICDLLGIEQPPPRPRHPDLPALDPQEAGTAP